MTIKKQQLSDDLNAMQENLDVLFQASASKHQLILQSLEDSKQTISGKQFNLLKGLGFNSVDNITQYEQNVEVLTRAGMAMETVEQLKAIKNKYNKYIISYNNMSALCIKHNLYFGDAPLFIGTMPMKNVEEIENFPFSEFSSHYNALTARCNESIVSGNISTQSRAMIVAPLNLFKLKDVFIANSRELIQYSGINSRCIFPVAEDPIVVLPFKTTSTPEIFFLIITHWDSSKSII